jgi:hypothetical protein
MFSLFFLTNVHIDRLFLILEISTRKFLIQNFFGACFSKGNMEFTLCVKEGHLRSSRRKGRDLWTSCMCSCSVVSALSCFWLLQLFSSGFWILLWKVSLNKIPLFSELYNVFFSVEAQGRKDLNTQEQ